MICEEITAWAYLHDHLIIFKRMDYGERNVFGGLRLASKAFFQWLLPD